MVFAKPYYLYNHLNIYNYTTMLYNLIMNKLQLLRTITNMSQSEYAEYMHIPVYNIRNWEQGNRQPLDYVVDMMERIMISDGYNTQLNEIKILQSYKHKINYYIEEDRQAGKAIVFYYDKVKYRIPAPNISNQEYEEILFRDGSSFYVDDKIDDIIFEKRFCE